MTSEDRSLLQQDLTSIATHSPCQKAWLHTLTRLAAIVLFGLFTIVSSGSADAAVQETQSSNGVTAQSASPDCLGWSVVGAANDNDGILYGVDGVARDDLWAVGTRGEIVNGNPIQKTLIEHWNGTQWTQVPSPNGGTQPYNASTLIGVTVIAPDDVWAIGRWSEGNNIAPHLPLALHWDGSIWSIVTTPDNLSYLDYSPANITAISGSEVWVVGQIEAPSASHYDNWTMHWDGNSWSEISVPNPGASYNYLFGVSGSASNDVWATGSAMSGTTGGATLLHWDGASWQQTTYPGDIAGGSLAVKSFGPNDVWTVGVFHNSQQGIDSPVALHYDGSSWQSVVMPAVPGFTESILRGLDGSGPNDLWAVGTKRTRGGISLVWSYYWDGTAWSAVYNPTSSGGDDLNLNVWSVKSLGPQEAWLVGYDVKGPVVEQFSNPAASCLLEFADVPSGSTFYQYVQCLACRALLNGYPCGGVGEPCDPQNDPYFRPANSITRGQLSKIISNAAQFYPDDSYQRCQDVAPGNTYFEPIQSLAVHEFISGYACGGANEPCVPPYNLPYFRPGVTATRAQIAKIISNAQRLIDDPGIQQFEDVPPTDGFFPYVQRLANRGAVGGYPCGSPGEPCVPPENRSYFRPGSNASRGQLAKITNILFFNFATP